jgi:hypothetical protein
MERYMSVHPLLPRVAAILALSTLVACGADSPTAPQQRQLSPLKPALDVCSGYSVADGKC